MFKQKHGWVTKMAVRKQELPSPHSVFLHTDPSGATEGTHGGKREGKHSEGINGSEGSGAEDDLGDGNQR